jgi:hypothetical protein
MLFRMKRRNQCKHKATLKENWIITEEVRCDRDAEHPGMHRARTSTGAVIQWMTHDRIDRFFGEHGKTF